MSNTAPQSRLLELSHSLVDEEDVILSVSDELDETLNEQVKNTNIEVSRSDLLHSLKLCILDTIDDDERASDLARNIYTFLIIASENGITIMKETDASEALISYLRRLLLRYNANVKNIYMSGRQGENYWKRIKSDVTLRSPDRVAGINYKIYTGLTDKSELTVSLSSNLGLIEQLLAAQERAINSLGPLSLNEASIEQLEQIESMVQEMQRKAKESVEQTEGHNDAGEQNE